ncbi:hypothetical protein HYX08_04605 [Candidatus Woesearchaeota archaeon]|nr:hypothetical protein [Candidatus Woesearchaeota archaeon]
MRNKIMACIVLVLLMANTANAEKYFVLDVNQIIGSVTFNSISLREIDRAVKYTDNAGFMAKTISFQNSEISSIYYNMPENKNYLIYIPYNENAARIELYNLKNSKIMDIDVSSFANTCGNNFCEEHESHESCTKDCSSGGKDDFCDGLKDGICDPDCSTKTDEDCGGTEKSANASAAGKPELQGNKPAEEAKKTEKDISYISWALYALPIIIILLLFLFFKKRKEGKTIGMLRQYISDNIRKGFNLQQIKDVLYKEGYSEKEVDKAIKAI